MKLKAVRALPKYKLHLTYADGRESIYDASWATRHLSNFFDQLIDLNYFAQVSVDGAGVEWPNGQSIGPEDLQEHSVLVVEEKINRPMPIKRRCAI